ncbi:unnamed protein product [Pieris brassicae]|uniref:RNA polymerase II-associated protein 3 n=1 Tax=Pieris brassicae TaxID=7116 RepID=A0A9P0THS4_PIEBR|nr:unnamed protein product [Pieris brassicae]
MDKVFEIQKNARDNVKSLQTYLTDLQNWESEMKRKEAALNGNFEQDLPPVRSKTRKERPIQVKKKQLNRISSSDYSSWEKFDVDKACEEVDMAEMGPMSLDSKQSEQEKQEKLREEAQYEKERGNTFVKQEKWDDAISCYNRAIELVKNDAIYYANRGLCYLKKDSLHQAEKDCTEALKLDSTYVKALQRRATAREKLGSLRSASADLHEVLKLEPNNVAARKQLETIKARMGTKGSKSKSSPLSTPTLESKSITPIESKPKVVEITTAESTPQEKWKNGVGENITVIKTVKKPPHLRSKRALKHITIQEIPLGCTVPKVEAKTIDNLAQGDTNNNSDETKDCALSAKGDNIEINSTEIKSMDKMVPPVNSVQFMNEWKCLKGSVEARSNYLNIIDPSNIPSIFANALESDVLSELLSVLYEFKDRYTRGLSLYLQAFTRVKRFSALAMFLADNDKLLVNKMLVHCKTKEGLSDDKINELKNKYEF